MDRYAAIRYAVRIRVVAKFLSQLYGLLALLTIVPCLFAFLSGSSRSGIAYVAVILLLGMTGILGRRLPRVTEIQRNEAATIVALAFVGASLLLSIPVMTFGIGFVDAWFEAVSGVTTTGLSTLDLTGMPAAFLFARGWSQWVGGVGVVILALALLLRSGHATKSLGFSNREVGNVVGGTRAHARRVVLIYLCLTTIGVALLLIAGATPLDAIVHSMTAVSTGGFANAPDSLAGVTDIEVSVINGLCLAGAISFHVYYASLLRITRGQRLDSQLYMLLALVVVLTLLTGLLSRVTGFELAWLDALSMVVSAQTTAGFATLDMSILPLWLVLLLSVAMFVGGGIGSTSGGIKIGRLLLVLTWMRSYFVRTSLPESAHTDVRIDGRRVTGDDLQDVFAVIGAFVFVLFVSWFIFLLYDYPALPALFEVTSALSTAGLSVGVTSSELPWVLKTVLCFDMLFGRVEVVALLVVLMPRSWFGRRRRIPD